MCRYLRFQLRGVANTTPPKPIAARLMTRNHPAQVVCLNISNDAGDDDKEQTMLQSETEQIRFFPNQTRCRTRHCDRLR
jgi:hypothetical protein